MYDMVIWEVVALFLQRIGVLKKFREWIQVYIKTPRFAIMINGAPYGYFGKKEGQDREILCPLIFLC